MKYEVVLQWPASSIDGVRNLLAAFEIWADVRVAYRNIERSEYVVLWHEGLKEFEIF